MTSTRTPARPGWRPGFSRAGSWYLPGAVSLTVLWLLAHSLAPANGLTRSYYHPLGGSTLPVVAERITAVDLAFIDTIPLLRAVDHGSDFVPAHVTGGVVTPDTRIAPPLAVVLNGVVAAVTRPYHFPAYGHAVPWEAVVDPRLIEQGANTVQVFAIRDTPEGTVALDEARVVE